MAGGRRVPRFDGVHGGLDESLEELLDIFVEDGVLDCHGRLAGQGEEQVFVLGREGAVQFIQDLQDADDLLVFVAHRGAQDVARPVSRAAIRLLVESGVGVRIRDVDRLPGLGDVTRDAHADLDPDLAHLQTLRDL